MSCRARALPQKKKAGKTRRAGRLAGLAAALAVTVSGCVPANNAGTRHDESWYQAIVEPRQSDADRIAVFYGNLITMKASELAGELDMARQSFENDKSELNRLELALLLSLPGTAFRDDGATLALLQPLLKDKSRKGSPLRPLAALLHTELVELSRTEETLQQQSAKLKEEQRRAEVLQQKLEAILDMEMKMIEREQTIPKKK
jgi:hypothetical protein